ncbi:MAG: serine O-acetyltransferase [Candidatus Gastranaerophilaceae bacterium]|jgi:serine O-acetyltransferase|nr:serine acetyltransferase [Clostridium sp. CAG:306]
MLLKRAFEQIKEDIKTIYDKDPAADNIIEVLLCYPGLHALILHRIAHKLRYWGIPVIPRMISYCSRILTGIEIHPGARIGRRFFIDHGMGVVIGETTYIGNDVLIYQGVTLGGTGKEHGKRHPTLEDNVIVGAGAKVLGNLRIGKNSRIGAGSVVVDNVPDDCTVVGIPGRIVHQRIMVDGQLMHNRMPDPVKCQLNRLNYEVQEIKEQLNITTSGRTDC